MSKFKVGDKIKVIKTEATKEEWKGIGEVDCPFEIGDQFSVLEINKNDGVRIQTKESNLYYYPKEMFKLVEKEYYLV